MYKRQEQKDVLKVLYQYFRDMFAADTHQGYRQVIVSVNSHNDQMNQGVCGDVEYDEVIVDRMII